MVETVTTMMSLLMSAGSAGVIVLAIWEDRHALRRALAGPALATAPLPPHTHRIAGPRRARFVRIAAPAAGLRAAA